jgi:hypothetical protein
MAGHSACEDGWKSTAGMWRIVEIRKELQFWACMRLPIL